MDIETLDRFFTKYERIDNKDGIVSVKGRCIFHNAPFEFSILPQNSNRYPMRGRVKAVDESGETLRLRGKDLEKVLATIKNNKTENNPRLKVMKDVYCTSFRDFEIKNAIYESVKKLYEDNRILINSQLSNDARPEKITLFWAIQKKGRAYVNAYHPKASPETQDSIFNRLLNLCEDLPDKPMSKYTESGFDKLQKELPINPDNTRELKQFWDFCIEAGTCDGENPVRIKKSTQKNPKRDQRNAIIRKELDVAEQNRLYEKLKSAKPNAKAGVALMLSGFPVSLIVKLKWKDIDFKRTYDFVVVNFIRPKAAGATQVYSRPVVPRSAELIRDVYNELKKVNPEIDNEKVISGSDLSAVDNRAGALIQDATRLLQSIDISYARIGMIAEYNKAAASIMLSSTYKRNIITFCNLDPNDGTCKYLSGEAFKNDSTSDSYTSFSDEAGLKRLYDILQILKEPKVFRKRESVTIDEKNKTVSYLPKDTQEYALVSGYIGPIPPGSKIKIKCSHGLIGAISGELKKKELTIY